MIPKIIFTIWISEDPLPERYHKTVATHALSGYIHKRIDLKEAMKFSTNFVYLHEAIRARKWIKVTDYLRVWYLCHGGGIYLDCDMSILKSFDALLNNAMFVGRENDQVIGNSIIGAEQGHPLLKKYLYMVEDNFRGFGEMIFEPAERLLSDLVLGKYGKAGPVTTYSSEYFFPFDEEGRGEITENSYTNHGFTRSWKL